jgi:hypothetical protein
MVCEEGGRFVSTVNGMSRFEVMAESQPFAYCMMTFDIEPDTQLIPELNEIWFKINNWAATERDRALQQIATDPTHPRFYEAQKYFDER